MAGKRIIRHGILDEISAIPFTCVLSSVSSPALVFLSVFSWLFGGCCLESNVQIRFALKRAAAEKKRENWVIAIKVQYAYVRAVT